MSPSQSVTVGFLLYFYFLMYWKKMKVLVWNVRGMGCPQKMNVVRDVIRSSRSEICCIQETKMNTHDFNYLSRILPSFSETNCAVLYALGTAGGCLVTWKRNYELINSWTTRHTVTAVLRQTATGSILAVTSVYGPSQD